MHACVRACVRVCVYVCVRQTDRQTDRDRETETEAQRERETESERERQSEIVFSCNLAKIPDVEKYFSANANEGIKWIFLSRFGGIALVKTEADERQQAARGRGHNCI